MASMTVFKFPTADGAEQGLTLVQGLANDRLITLQDAAIVTWPQGAKKPKTRQLHNLAGAGALNGAFWGMLFGLIFFVPFFGLAIGAAIGALTGKFADVGIDDNFVKQVRDKVTEGTSALFLLTKDAVIDRVEERVKAAEAAGMPRPEFISSNLSREQEDQLRDMFGDEEAPAPAS
ncbi:MAG: DUF1269 domain-containing protein [Dehalococcoidia bacterium]